jgi:hypothetical protein
LQISSLFFYSKSGYKKQSRQPKNSCAYEIYTGNAYQKQLPVCDLTQYADQKQLPVCDLLLNGKQKTAGGLRFTPERQVKNSFWLAI